MFISPVKIGSDCHFYLTNAITTLERSMIALRVYPLFVDLHPPTTMGTIDTCHVGD
jgi:hypothetical protein